MSPTDHFDITFIGHVCFDEIIPFKGPTVHAPGSAVLYGSVVAQRLGMKTAAVTRMNPADEHVVAPMRELGVAIFITPTPFTTCPRTVFPSENIDERHATYPHDAGPFAIQDLPEGLKSDRVHVSGICSREFSLEFIRALSRAGYPLSVDMQCFVRFIRPDGELVYRDFPGKREVAALIKTIKLDVVEAGILTGTRHAADAARTFLDWGANEVLVTEQSGVTLAIGNEIHRSAFTNRSQVGRTGRGDTTMSAYLCRRRTHPPGEALRFAAALASIKMETAGPFAGTLDEVERRMGDV